MILSQFVKFVGVGSINTIVTYLLYLLLLHFASYQVSYTMAYIFGIWLSYWLNLKFVFQAKGSRKKIVLFPLVYLAQYLFGMLVLYVAIDTLNISEKIAPILIVLFTVPLTFILTKTILSEKK